MRGKVLRLRQKNKSSKSVSLLSKTQSGLQGCRCPKSIEVCKIWSNLSLDSRSSCQTELFQVWVQSLFSFPTGGSFVFRSARVAKLWLAVRLTPQSKYSGWTPPRSKRWQDSARAKLRILVLMVWKCSFTPSCCRKRGSHTTYSKVGKGT